MLSAGEQPSDDGRRVEMVNYPLAIGQGCTTERIVGVAEAVPTTAAVEDWCNDPVQSGENLWVLVARSAR